MAKPTHYKVICISMYTKDLQELDDKVLALKGRGYALRKVDVNKVTKGLNDGG